MNIAQLNVIALVIEVVVIAHSELNIAHNY